MAPPTALAAGVEAIGLDAAPAAIDLDRCGVDDDIAHPLLEQEAWSQKPSRPAS
jgi:hypothetical protein